MSKRVANTPTSQKHGDGYPPPNTEVSRELRLEILLHNREIDKKKQAKRARQAGQTLLRLSRGKKQVIL